MGKHLGIITNKNVSAKMNAQKRMNFLFVLFFSIVCHLAVIVQAGFAEVVDRVAAVVNDDIVSLYDLNQILAPQIQKIKSMGYPFEKEHGILKKLRGEAIERLIDQKLADQESRRAGITVTDREVDATIERVKKAYDYTDKELREFLAAQDTTLEDFREHWKSRLVMTKLINREVKSRIVITDEDVKAYYDSHPELYGGEKKYHLRNIILKFPPFADEQEKRELRKKMEKIRSELESGKLFYKAAEEYSESFASKGGDIGVFPSGRLSPKLLEAIKDLKEGEYTEIIETDPGYQIFYIENIIFSSGKPLEEVSPEIEERLYKEIVENKYRSWLEKLRKQSYIKIY